MREAISNLWEKRSKSYGRSLEGVMSKSFPRPLNEFLDQWMYDCVKEIIPKNKKLKILDVGCGYGRLSKRLLDDFKDVHTIGVDIAQGYVDLYNEDLNPRGKAFVADIAKLPFPNKSFDRVFVVTTLMYVTTRIDQQSAMKEIFRVLRKGGKIVIIERSPLGYGWVTLGGIIGFLRGKKNSEIKAVSYNKDTMTGLLNSNGGVLTSVKGIPLLTLLFPLIYVISMFGKALASKSLLEINKYNILFYPLLTVSLYIAYTIRKT